MFEYTEYWDDLCGCSASDGITVDHAPDYATMNARSD